MFKYTGEITEYRQYIGYGVLSTNITGLRDSKPETLALLTKIPNDKKKRGKIEIMVADQSSDGRFQVRGSLDLEIEKEEEYKKVKIENLLHVHSLCLEELRNGKLINYSKIADFILNDCRTS